MSHKTSSQKKRKPRYDATRKAEVIAKKVQGKSEREIALDLKMSRNTVAKITSDEEYNAVIEHYRREATKLIAPSLRILEQALLLEDEPDAPPEKFEKITVIDDKELRKKLNDAYRRGYRRGLKSGADGLKASLGVAIGTQVFRTRSQSDVSVKPADAIDKLGDRELDARIREAEQRLKEAQNSQGDEE